MEDRDGLPVLALSSEWDGERYVQYIYGYQGQLCELFTAAEYDFAPEDGEPVCAAQAFEPTLEGDLLTVRVTGPATFPRCISRAGARSKGMAMVKHNRQNTLLMEILIVVLFFALCSTVILNVFVGAHNQSARAGAQADALIAAQSLADRLYAADERKDALRQSGFAEDEDGAWHLHCGAYDLLVTLGEEACPAGTMETAQVTALRQEKTLFSLPSARYVPEEVAP